jgi:Co/Zn/Cd efflux system component
MGLWVLGSTFYQVLILETPVAAIMSGIGVLALAANIASVLILYRFRDGDANVRSVWLCSRNDAIGNLAVIGAAGAAGAVWFTASAWPDLMVAMAMASLFLNSAYLIIRQALQELRIDREAQASELT